MTTGEQTGLTSAEAARRLAVDGPNALPHEQRLSWSRTVPDYRQQVSL